MCMSFHLEKVMFFKENTKNTYVLGYLKIFNDIYLKYIHIFKK